MLVVWDWATALVNAEMIRFSLPFADWWRSVLVRFSIWKITDDTVQSEQAFSVDGGKTWEVNWINHYTRLNGDS